MRFIKFKAICPNQISSHLKIDNINGQRKYSKRYSDTLNLPKSKFQATVLDGKSVVARELTVQKECSFDKHYRWQRKENTNGEFTLHDGPPYANGKPHVGHAVNKILKDITNRYKVLRGLRVHYVPGWDCHGLPIELKALGEEGQNYKNLSPLEIRKKARLYAEKAIKIQRDAFKRWGVMADWENAYKTMDAKYEAHQLTVFYDMYKKGLVYRDLMPVYWSPSSRTALAEAELEYNDHHISKSVYVSFPVTKPSPTLAQHLEAGKRIFALIWTTTPWTLPANQALCYNKSINYSLLEDIIKGDIYLCEASFVPKFQVISHKQFKVLSTFEGTALESTQYENPLTKETLPFLPADHVVAEKGTGLVHTAPAHGHDDFSIALKHNISIMSLLDEAGSYTEAAGAELHGKTVGDNAEDAVISLLGDHVMHIEDITHSYPYDWRTRRPVIIRASKQWFINTQQLRQPALECLKDVQIFPKASEQGMLSQLQQRSYWCISRQRVWGVPIPVFFHNQTGQVLLNSSIFEHIHNLFLCHGSDCWWTLTQEELLPKSLLSKSGLGHSEDYTKGSDILDIWFDSGTSWASVLKDQGYQADLYLEGIDQFGGWFQSSLLTSVAINNKAPYRNLLVHGFTLDEEGRKMSKSIGNVVDPDVVINGGKDLELFPPYGADVLRWWVGAASLHSKIFIGPVTLNSIKENLFKVRKLIKFILGNLRDFSPSSNLVDYNTLWPQDQYMLHLLYKFGKQISKSYDQNEYGRVLQMVEKFMNSEVSSFYCHIIKDRCYCGDSKGIPRRSSQTVLFSILKVLTKALAPILPHLAEEIFQNYPDRAKEYHK
ncbi:hypothetical protein ACJMK2_037312, partial [Sinanodonta woodiana]